MSNPFQILQILSIETKHRLDMLNVHKINKSRAKEIDKQGKALENLYTKWGNKKFELTTSHAEYHIGYETTKIVRETIDKLFNACRWFACGLNATWSCEAWCYTFRISDVERADGGFYVLDYEDGNFGVARRWFSRDGEDEVETLGTFQNRAMAQNWVEDNYEKLTRKDK